jgi:hypothetical protein
MIFSSLLSFFDGSHCLFDWLKRMALPSSVLPSKEKKKKKKIWSSFSGLET